MTSEIRLRFSVCSPHSESLEIDIVSFSESLEMEMMSLSSIIQFNQILFDDFKRA